MSHKYFMPFISVCILGNTVVLAFSKYPIDGSKQVMLDYANEIFYLVFLFELVVRLIGEGHKSYFS